jgi:hypothetical protein
MAMDYEWSIKVCERELAHLREMQALHRAHLDAHDGALNVVGGRMDRIEATLERTAAMQEITERKMQGLIDILAREHSNGRPKAS